MQPNHCDLLGQVQEPRAARQMMRDGQPGQPRPSGATPMRSEGTFLLIPGPAVYPMLVEFTIMHILLKPLYHVLTAVLYRLVDRGVITALLFVPVLGRYQRRHHHHRSSGRASRGRQVPAPQSSSAPTKFGCCGDRPGRLFLARSQPRQQQPRGI